MAHEPSITIIEHGPYVVTGDVPLYEDVLVEASDGAHLQYNRLKEYEVGVHDESFKDRPEL